MANDHFIARTYLRPFCGEDGLLQKYYKNGVVTESTRRVSTKSVCRIENWDTHPSLSDPTAVEKFLKLYENRWGNAIMKLNPSNYSSAIKEIISGYIHYMQAMTPLGRQRIKAIITAGIQARADVTYNQFLSKKNKGIASEEELGFIEDFQECGGGSCLEANENYLNAYFVQSLFKLCPHDIYTSGKWQILVNNTDIPFITSDHPILLLEPDQLITRTFIPLTPKIGLIITPNLNKHSLSRERFGISGKIYAPIGFDEFKEVKIRYVKALNVRIIKTAKDIVLTSEKNPCIKQSVDEFKHWELQYLNSQQTISDGYILASTTKLVNTKKINK